MFKSYLEGIADSTSRQVPRLQSQGEESSLAFEGRTLIVSGTDKISRKYDTVFSLYADRLPLPFIRALAYSESRLNPNESKGGFWGILQVGWKKKSVLPGYNKRFGTSYTKEDLFDPAINAKVALELVNRIVRNYSEVSKENPRYMRNFRTDFNNPEFVKLLLAGWNSGYSRSAGVQYMGRWLAKRNLPVTHDNIFKYAQQAGASRWLRETSPDAHTAMMGKRKKKWQAGVQKRFFAMSDFTPLSPNARGDGDDDDGGEGVPIRPSRVGPVLALMLVPLGLLALLGKG